MEALMDVLTRERLLAELLVFKLVELRQLLTAGEARFLPWAAEEVERATGALRRAELERAVVVSGLAEERGLPEDVRLGDLVTDVAEPWRTVLVEQADHLRALCTEAADLLTAAGRLAETGLKGIDDLLGRTVDTGPADGLTLYGRGGRRDNGAPRPRVAQSL